MINVRHFRELVVRPALQAVQMWSPAAENLMVGTALAESDIGALKQIGGGPALSVYQIEPATFTDITGRYFGKRTDVAERCRRLLAPEPDAFMQLASNLAWATAVARVKYYMDPQPLPDEDDIEALGATWKRVYNTAGGAGTAASFAYRYRRHVVP